MELTGQIEEIIYQNELNGYMIAILKTFEEEITITGYLPFINKSDSIKVIGRYVNHPEYGRQFKVDSFEKVMPQTLDALEKMLSNGLIKGIGPVTASKIVAEFGEDTIDVLKDSPKKLTRIKGITVKKAEEISQSFIENWEVWNLVGFLEKFGIGPQSAQNVYKKLGQNAIEQIEQNPYILIEIGIRVDFKQIDKMALKLGIERNNLKRVSSGIRHALLLASANGHCCVLKDNLISFVVDLLGVSEEDVRDGIISLRAKDGIMEIEKSEDLEKEERSWIYLMPFYKAEYNIAENLINLQKSNNTKRIASFEKELKQVEKKTGLKLSEKQKEAVKTVNDFNVSIITGGPGTGKTTIIKTIIELYQKNGKKTVLCAPTGRAAKRMTEATRQEAKTLHRLLEIGKFSDDTNSPNIDLDITPIDADVIIVDEMSMVDIFLMNYLTKAIFKGTKLVLVGDTDQLPSVGPGSVLKDLISSNKIPTIVLNKIFRQAARSQIIVNSHKVNEGKSIFETEENEDTLEDFKYINEASSDRLIEKICLISKGKLKLNSTYQFENNVQIITPTKKGDLGTKNLNQILQAQLNPEELGKSEKRFGDVVFRQGDKVMQIKNNYDIYWEKQEPKFEAGSGIFNGEMGQIEIIDDENNQIQIRFDDGKCAMYGYGELEQIEHSYAITVHKSQGSEFDVVVLVIPKVSPMLLNRNLLYTGMTRAKKMLVLLANPTTIEFMTNNVNIKKRNTGLCFMLNQLSK